MKKFQSPKPALSGAEGFQIPSHKEQPFTLGTWVLGLGSFLLFLLPLGMGLLLAQTTPAAPDQTAAATYQTFRGSRHLTGAQQMKGNLSAVPTVKWEVLTAGGAEGEPAIGDVNNDGSTDVVGGNGIIYTVNGTTGSLLWTFNGGIGGGGYGTPVISDVDGNGFMDVLIAGDTVFLLNGSTGTPIWTSNPVNSVFSSAIAIDLNNNGSLEVVFQSDSLIYALNGNNGTLLWSYSTPSTMLPGAIFGNLSSPAAGDIDNDGQVDVVAIVSLKSPNPPTVYALNGNNGTLKWTHPLSPGLVLASPIIADVNGDCSMDVLVPSGFNKIEILNGVTGALLWSIDSCRPYAFAVADIDNTCTMEVITAGPRAYNGSNGSLLWDAAGPMGGYLAPAPKVGDFDPNSSVLEIITGKSYGKDTSTSPEIFMYSSTGTLLWDFNKLNQSPEGFSVGDIDNDGCVEIVVNPDADHNSFYALDDIAGANGCGFTSPCPISGLNTSISGATTICAGNMATLSVSGGGMYSWSTGGTTSSIIITPTATTNYSVVVTSGCKDKDTAFTTVTVVPTITATIGGPATLCAGNTTTLTASGGGNYSWSNGQTTTSITITPTTTTTYSVIVSSGSCSDTAIVTVTAASIIASHSASICSGSTYTLPGGTLVSIGGTYNDTLTSVGGCDSIITTILTVNPNPVANAYSNVTITQGQSVTLTASGPPNGIYSWSNGENGSSITVVPLVTTIYCVTVTDANNCTDTACVMVPIEPIDCSTAGELYLPNAFSPNDDGENDVLQIYYGNINCIKTLKLNIYDRWGGKVFESTGINMAWNGTYSPDGGWAGKGKIMSTAVFVYYLEATLITGETIIKKGNISLVR